MEEIMKTSDLSEKQPRFKEERSVGEHPSGDRGQIVCLVVFLLIWALDSFVFKLTTVLVPLFPLSLRLTASALAFILAVYFTRNGHRAVPEESLGAKCLLKDGAFARVRHPLYSGSLLFYMGLFLSTLSLAALAAWCIIGFFYNFIATYEERLLLAKYGREYREYQQKVPKWVPRLRPAKFA
jgi:protein-S-isoprenylcysteine O-methyltransferase Ste14